MQGQLWFNQGSSSLFLFTSTVYDIAFVDLTTNTWRLNSSHGDVTSVFTIGLKFAVFGNTGIDKANILFPTYQPTTVYEVLTSTFNPPYTDITISSAPSSAPPFVNVESIIPSEACLDTPANCGLPFFVGGPLSDGRLYAMTEWHELAYADDVFNLDWKGSVRVTTTAALTTAYTYNNGASGVGATITSNVNVDINTDGGIDPPTSPLVVGDRVLIKDETIENGIYEVTQVGSGAAPFILTRSTDADTDAKVTAGMATVAEEGTTFADTAWWLATNNPITLGTTVLVFSQFAPPIEPLNQIVYGTGTGIDSEADFTWDPTTDTMMVGGVGDVGTITNGDGGTFEFDGGVLRLTGANADTLEVGASINLTLAGGTAINLQTVSGNIDFYNNGSQTGRLSTTSLFFGDAASAAANAVAIGNTATASGARGVAIGFNTSAGASGVAIGGNTGTGATAVASAVAIGAGTTGASAAAGNAIAIGCDSTSVTAAGLAGVAVGRLANVQGNSGIAIGNTAGTGAGTGAVGESIAIGRSATTSTVDRAIALGRTAGVGTDATYGIALGYTSLVTAFAVDSIAVGRGAVAGNSIDQIDIIAIGHGATATRTNSIAIGLNALANTTGQDCIAIGPGASADNDDTVAIGATANAAGDGSTAVGSGAVATTSAVALGIGANASGGSAIAIGDNANASASHSVAIGAGLPTSYGQFAYSSVYVNTTGDAQTSAYTLAAITTDNTPTELFLNFPLMTQRMVLQDDTTWHFEIKVVARRTDANNEGLALKSEGAIDRNVGAATTALIGTTTDTTLADDNAGAWVVAVSADTTNGALIITVTGEIGKDISWVAFVRTVEVTG